MIICMTVRHCSASVAFPAVPSIIAFVGRPWIGHVWPDVGKDLSLSADLAGEK